MAAKQLRDRRASAVPRGVGNVTPVAMTRAEGALMWDSEGNQHIDFAGGIGVNNVGHRHPQVVEAIKNQADDRCFPVARSALGPQKTRLPLLRPELARAEGGKRVFCSCKAKFHSRQNPGG